VTINNLYDISKEELMELVIKQQKEIEGLKKENQILNQYIDNKVRKTQHIYMMYFEQEPDKVYIGKTRQPVRRPTEHKNELRNNRHSNKDLQDFFNKYGEESFIFKIIDTVRMSDADALIHESKIIDQYKTKHEILNRVHNETFQGGRPKDFVDADKFAEVYLDWKSRKIKATEAIELLGISTGMFYRRIKVLDNVQEGERVRRNPKSTLY
jgi:predicted GIY-YIG superfamily endonuclease